MSKLKTLTRSLLQVFVGVTVLALGLFWPFLSIAQNKSDQGPDSTPHAQHQEKQSAGGQDPGGQKPSMKMPDISSKKQTSAWWFENYTLGQKQGMDGKDMAHGEGGMADMTGMTKATMDAASMAEDSYESGVRMINDVDLMGMMDDSISSMGEVATGGAKSKRLKGMDEMKMASTLPGSPGVSHLYHIGATRFFLNHSEHLALSTRQQAALNVVQRKALLSKFTAQRQIEEAEQELWELTGSDEPDGASIQVTVQAIAKLRGEQRMAFIQSVGEAARVLTDEQRRMLLGITEPLLPRASNQ